MKILIADDDAKHVDTVKKFLIKNGHTVDVAFNGRMAVDSVKANSYDIVFVDHNMPELTGLEVITTIKKNGFTGKVVMSTGYPEMEKFFAEAIGADEYLRKPVWLETIGKIVEKYNNTKS